MLDHHDAYTPDVAAGLEAYVAAQVEKDSLPKAANDLLRDALTGLGFIGYQEVPAGAVDPDA